MTAVIDKPKFETVTRRRSAARVDLAAQWHHGWVPANAEAMRIKAGLIGKNGGFSLNKNGNAPKSGYMVSFDAKHGGVETTISGEVTAEHIAAHQTAVAPMLKSPRNYHGAWKDPESGKTFLDVSRNHRDIESAALHAKEQNQLAIYDVKNGKSITTREALRMAAKAKRDRQLTSDTVTSSNPKLQKTIDIFRGFREDNTAESARRDNVRKEVGVTVASHIRSVEQTYGSDRSKWPKELLAAAAPYDMVARIHYDKIPKVGGHVSRKVPKTVHRHRPHTEKATDDASRDLGRNPTDVLEEVGNRDRSKLAWTNRSKPKKGKSVKRTTQKVSLSNVDLAITPGGRQGDASPLGKKGSKRKLSDYEREVAHALMRKGKSKRDAIKMARGIINHAAATGRWSKGKAKPNVVAGAQASIAQRKSFSNTDTSDIDLGVMGHGILTGTPFTKKGADKQAARDRAFDRAGKGAKWHHGWIPANHAAELIAGSRVRPRTLQGIDRASKRRGTVVGTRPQPGSKYNYVKVKWHDTGKVTEHESLALEVKGAITKQLSLSNDIDLVAKWKHGFIPLNAEAMAIKEHRAKGHGTSSGSSNPLVGHTKYHSDKTRAKLNQNDLRAHAKAHAAAAPRARTHEAAMKHVKEAQASMDEILKRQGAARNRKNFSTRGANATGPKSGKGKKAAIGSKGHDKWSVEHQDTRGEDLAKEDDLSGKKKAAAKAKAAKAREVTHKDDLGDTHTHEVASSGPLGKMAPKELSAELKKAEKAGNTKRVTALKKEKVRRLAAVKAAKSQHDEAAKWVDKHWSELDPKDPKSVSKFLGAVVKIFPAAKSKLWSLKDKNGKISGIKNAEAFKIVLSEVFREFARQISGPILATGIGSIAGTLGIGILKAHGG
jgi:hypothetical protein